MKKVISMIALAAICFGSVYAEVPIKVSHSVADTIVKKKMKMKRAHGMKKKVKMKKDTSKTMDTTKKAY